MMVNGLFFCLVCTFCIYIQIKLNLYLSEQILLSSTYFLLANKKSTRLLVVSEYIITENILHFANI